MMNDGDDGDSVGIPSELEDLTKWMENVEAEDEAEEEEDLLDSIEKDEEIINELEIKPVKWNETRHAQQIESSRNLLKSGFNGASHLVQFETAVQKNNVMMSHVSNQDAQEKLDLLRAKQEETHKHLKNIFTRQRQDLAAREVAARKRVVELHTGAGEHVLAAKRAVVAAINTSRGRIRRDFERCEEALRENLEKRQIYIEEKHGILKPDRTYKPKDILLRSTGITPRKLGLKFQFLRGVKDKLPRGSYAFAIHMLDELGGVSLRFKKSTNANDLETLVTNPVKHSGRFSDFEVPIKQELTLLCPPESEARPSNVVILELYQTAGSNDKAPVYQRVIGWTALPLLDGEGNLNYGRFRLPIIKGGYDSRFDRYYKLEQKYCEDLDAWLCNAYIVLEKPEAQSSMELAATVENMDVSKELEYLNVKTTTNFAEKPSLLRKIFRFSKKREIHPAQPNEKPPKLLNVKSTVLEETSTGPKNITENDLPMLETYEYAVQRTPIPKGTENVSAKLSYVAQELRTTFSMKRWTKTNETWLVILLACVAFWFRMYIHYLGQYAYLLDGRAVVFDFRILPHKCLLKYSSTSMPLSQLVSVMMLGSIFPLVTFLLLALLIGLTQRFIRHIPSAASKFVLLFGIFTILDPILILVSDLITGDYNCETACPLTNVNHKDCMCAETEASRILSRFKLLEGSVINGIYVLFAVYAFLILFSAGAFTVYVAFLHKTGRAHDLYRRLHKTENGFFIPHDSEVTSRYVSLAGNRAERWIGARGAKREITLDKEKDNQLVYTIHQIETSGFRKIWRSFKKRSDGAIVEQELH